MQCFPKGQSCPRVVTQVTVLCMQSEARVSAISKKRVSRRSTASRRRLCMLACALLMAAAALAVGLASPILSVDELPRTLAAALLAHRLKEAKSPGGAGGNGVALHEDVSILLQHVRDGVSTRKLLLPSGGKSRGSKRWDKLKNLAGLDELRMQRPQSNSSATATNAVYVDAVEAALWKRLQQLDVDLPMPLQSALVTFHAAKDSSTCTHPWLLEEDALLLDEYLRGADVDEILEALGPLRSTREFTEAIVAFGRLKRPDRALAALREASEAGLTLDLVAYNAALGACAKGKDWQAALELLRRMRARALPPLARRTHLVRVSDGRRGAASLCSGRARRIHPLRANLHCKPVSPHLCRHVLAHVSTCKSPGFLCKL